MQRKREYIRLVWLAVMLWFAGCGGGGEPTSLQKLPYFVIKIGDGDTVTLLEESTKTQVKVRLQNIDAPEKKQDFGQKARQFTADLCFNKHVDLIKHSTDQYGRVLGEIILADGRNLNRLLVQEGYAWVYDQYNKDPELPALEKQARKEKKGLWGHSSKPVAPWEWRKNEGVGRHNKKDKNSTRKKPSNPDDDESDESLESKQ